MTDKACLCVSLCVCLSVCVCVCVCVGFFVLGDVVPLLS